MDWFLYDNSLRHERVKFNLLADKITILYLHDICIIVNINECIE